ncbi:MAG: transcriptional repressor [Chitinophagales bacterium]|nr:transcriptional repressor [Chitinophagales bacterium]MDW8428492.1 transcriptional repressor [Chitinophagales bacterium]
MNQELLLQRARHLFDDYLKAHRLRRTPERFAVLETLYRSNEHLDAEKIYQLLRRRRRSISRATVYNTLDLLVKCELALRHQFEPHQARYERAYGARQHDHLICLHCRKVVEFCDPRIHQISTRMGALFDFRIAHHSLILYGYCSDCHGKSAHTESSSNPLLHDLPKSTHR